MRTRLRAGELVAEVVHGGRSLSRLLPALAGEFPEDRDRGFAKTLAFDTLRFWERYRFLLSVLLGKPLRRDAHLLEALLAVGLCQLDHLQVAPHAAVAETVNAVRAGAGSGAAGLANAVLRRFERERDVLIARVADVATARYAAPAWLLQRWQADWPDDWESLALAASERAPMWLRVNLVRTTRDAWLSRAEAAGLEATPHALLPAAVRLGRAVDVAALPGFAEGEVSVQDAAAQFVPGLLAPPPGGRVLDACAAPGGKSAHLCERFPDLRLLSLDSDEGRLARVAQTFTRLHLPGAGAEHRVLSADAGDPARWWDGEPYDRILLDAPCSASGVIRRHPDIKLLRRDDDLAQLHQEQLRLLRALWPLLAPGGRLLYVTCSVFRCENDDVIREFSALAADAEVTAPALPFGRNTPFGRQIMAGGDGMDGFYYAYLTKQ